MPRKNKQYRTVLSNYLKGKIGLPVFYERAAEYGVSATEAEDDVIQAKECAAGNQATENGRGEHGQGGEDVAITDAPKSN